MTADRQASVPLPGFAALLPVFGEASAPKTADARRTARQHAAIAAGKHPFGLPLAQNGQSCGQCDLAVHVSRGTRNSLWKCSRYSMSNSAASDLRVSWPACTAFRKPAPAGAQGSGIGTTAGDEPVVDPGPGAEVGGGDHGGGAASPPRHLCHHPCCDREVSPERLSCSPHWFALPGDLRREVWRHYRRGQEVDKRPSPQYLEAVQRCLREWDRQEPLASRGLSEVRVCRRPIGGR